MELTQSRGISRGIITERTTAFKGLINVALFLIFIEEKCIEESDTKQIYTASYIRLF